MKKIALSLAALAALLIVIASLTLGNIDKIVAKAIPYFGTKLLQTEVNLKAVDISLKEGKGSIKGLTVMNPDGYSNNRVFSLGETALEIDVASLPEDVYVLEDILVDAAEIRVEERNGQLNLQALQQNLPVGSSNTQKADTAKDNPVAKETQDVKLAIERLRLINIKAELVSEQFGSFTLVVPDIIQTDLGSASNGLTPAQLTEKLLRNILKNVEKAAKNALRTKAEEKAKELIEKEKAKAKEKLREEANKGIKKLFNK